MARRFAGRLIALALGLALCGPAAALDFPTLSGRVVDEANILDAAARGALTQKLADLEARSSDQLVVVILRSLQGTSIEDFGYQLGRRWQIGQKGKNNGVLLIVAPAERKVRIEVGYGLEGTLTDAIGKFIVENAIVPRFRANDFPGGIARGVDDIVQVLTGGGEEFKRRAAGGRRGSQNAVPHVVVTGVSNPVVAFLLMVGAFIALALFAVAGVAFVIGIGAVLLGAIVRFLTWLGVIPRQREGMLRWLDYLPNNAGTSPTARYYSSSSRFGSGSSRSSSSSSESFSGGGGSFGGGGASGSW